MINVHVVSFTLFAWTSPEIGDISSPLRNVSGELYYRQAVHFGA